MCWGSCRIVWTGPGWRIWSAVHRPLFPKERFFCCPPWERHLRSSAGQWWWRWQYGKKHHTWTRSQTNSGPQSRGLIWSYHYIPWALSSPRRNLRSDSTTTPSGTPRSGPTRKRGGLRFHPSSITKWLWQKILVWLLWDRHVHATVLTGNTLWGDASDSE